MAKKGRSFGENSRWNLGGMTALVTGGTKGIGEAVVEELAMFGAKVHTCARDEAQLQERLHEWQAKGFQVSTSVCDVSSRDQREKLMETVSSLFQGKLNILVNNAGTCIAKPTTEYTAQDFSFLMATNLESAFHLSQMAHPLLKASGSGSIVLMSSVAGVVHVDFGSVYGATKVMFSCIPPNGRPVKKPRFNELPECPVSGSSIACVGCRRVGLIESFVPTGMMSPDFPAGFLRPGEREQVLEFVTQMGAIYHNFELELRLYLSKRREYDERHADNVWTHARKHAKNDSLLLETIQKMMILESEPKDWVRMDFNSYYMMPECFYRLARERRGRRRAGDR